MSSLLEQASLVVTPNGTKASKLYSVKPTDGSGDMTVVRATTATRVNSSGIIESSAVNVPRLDYTDSTCPSLLVEPQRTNLWIQSEDFNSGDLTSGLITYTANSETSPSGTLTADKFEVTTSGGDAYRRFTRAIAVQNFSLSLYVKGVAGQKFQLFLSRDSFAEIKSIDVTLSGGWQRIVLTDSFSTTSSTVVMGVEFGFASNDSVAGQVYYVWGAQLEGGAYPTSYIPTTTASVTRNADVISKTGITDLIGQTEGTMYWEGYLDLSKSNYGYFPRLFAIGDGSSTNFAYLTLGSTNILQARIQISGINQTVLTYSIPTSGFYKIAFGYKQNDFILYVNGINRGTDNLGNVIGFPNVYLGRETGDSSAPVSHPIKSTILFKTRLTNAELATLTTL